MKPIELSFEFFPPKTPDGVEKLRATRAQLATLKPKFFSVTFGAGGSYTFGPATFGLVYTHTKLDDSQYFASAASPQGADVRFDILLRPGAHRLPSGLRSIHHQYVFHVVCSSRFSHRKCAFNGESERGAPSRHRGSRIAK